jgi:Ca2+-binding RTX toxin-like protein
MIEQLEYRRLLATTLTLGKTGIMRITGDAADDVVTISSQFVTENQPDSTNVQVQRLTFTLNGETFIVNKIKIKKMIVDMGEGNNVFAAGDNKHIPMSVVAGAGNDTLTTSSANDTIDGGAGNDYLYGGNKNDLIISAEGTDTIIGGAGDDTADYSARLGDLSLTMNDIIDDGESGDDLAYIGTDFETVLGGAGNDTISADGQGILTYHYFWGGGGRDSLLGGDGPDTLRGGRGNDSLTGGPGDDVLVGDAGKDSLRGGGGADTLFGGGSSKDYQQVFASIDDFRDTLSGGEGEDVGVADYADIVRSIDSTDYPNSTPT